METDWRRSDADAFTYTIFGSVRDPHTAERFHLELRVSAAMLNAAVEVKAAWAAIKTQTGGSTTMSHLVDEVTRMKTGWSSGREEKKRVCRCLELELVVAGSHKHARCGRPIPLRMPKMGISACSQR